MKKINRAYQKIENDFKEFERGILAKSAQEIYDEAYKISYVKEIYDFLIYAYELTVIEVRTILSFKGTEELLNEIITGEEKIRTPKFNYDRLREYFPKEYSIKQCEDALWEILENWFKK